MGQQNTNFNQWLQELGSIAAAGRWRYLLVLSGGQHWSRKLCASAALLAGEETLWVSTKEDGGGWIIPCTKATSLLGSETANIVYDAWAGFHPNGFAALAGTVRAGGLLVLRTPPLDQWARYADPDCQRMAVPGFSPRPESYFLRHLAATLQHNPQVLVVSEGHGLPSLPDVQVTVAVRDHGEYGDCCSEDQLKAVKAIEHVVGGHRDRPLVITADRGRGKSAALGIAAARLLADKLDYIVLTAPLASNVQTVFQHALQLLDGAQLQGHVLSWQGRKIQYLPPDELLRNLPAARLLLVDEAAAIPAALLSQMLDSYHRIVFTSTVHGYEGTGRGFAIRFARELQERRPHYTSMTMQQPVRWAQHDPLEHAVAQLLWLDAEALPDDELRNSDVEHLSIELIERGELSQQASLMQQLVGLLTTAHYRTTPDDTRLLLDAPNMQVMLARRGDKLVGAVLLAVEGGLETELIAGITAGQRRPRGHILPQALWAQTGNPDLLAKPGWRVVRIAVHPALQRHGLGLRMLQQLRSLALEQGIHYLGSSFGASADLLDFWRRAGYSPVSIGMRRDGSSGAHGLLVLQGFDHTTAELVAHQRRRFAATLPMLLTDELRQLESPIVVALLSWLAPLAYTLETDDRVDVHDFVSGARSYEHCRLALWKATLQLLADGQKSQQLEPLQRELIVGRILQQLDWTQLVQRSGLTGKTQMLACLRKALAHVVV